MRHKKYCVFNEQYSKERYEKFIVENKNFYIQNLVEREKVQDHYAKYPQPFAHHKRVENCTGDYLVNCKNTYNSFGVEEMWDCEDVFIALHLKNCCSCTSFGWGELCYEISSSIELYDCMFCVSTMNTKFARYCFVCQNSQYLFGCAGVKNKKYCILNKRYSKDEYEKMVPKIIEHMRGTGEWGEFFPSKISPFPYTDTVANDYFPVETRTQIPA